MEQLQPHESLNARRLGSGPKRRDILKPALKFIELASLDETMLHDEVITQMGDKTVGWKDGRDVTGGFCLAVSRSAEEELAEWPRGWKHSDWGLCLAMSDNNMARLIDAFHEAALEPKSWHAALGRLGQMVGDSRVVVMTAYEPAAGAHLFGSIGFNSEYWERVQAEHSTPKTNRYIDLMNAAQPGQALQPRTSMSMCEWLDDPIYRKFLRPDGLADGLACPLYHTGDGFAAIATFRSRHYDSKHLRILQAAAPHIRHALKVHLRLDAHATGARDGLAALDKLRAGVVLTDAQARVAAANAAAQSMLRRSTGISIGRGGLLVAARPDETNRLRALIKSAAEAAVRSDRQVDREGGQVAPGGSIRLSRPPDMDCLEVLVTPLRTAALPRSLSVHHHASVMLLIVDQDGVVGAEAAALRQMYGLTAAEARLTLQVLLGTDLPTAAIALGISINTAKTLLKRSFARTGTSSQAELAGKILRGPLGAIGVAARNRNVADAQSRVVSDAD